MILCYSWKRIETFVHKQKNAIIKHRNETNMQSSDLRLTPRAESTVFCKFFYRFSGWDCDKNHNSPWVYFFFALPQAAARFLHITLTSVGNSTRQKRHLISWTKHAATAWEFLPRMPLEPRGTPMVCGRKGRWRLNCKIRRRDHDDIYN